MYVYKDGCVKVKLTNIIRRVGNCVDNSFVVLREKQPYCGKNWKHSASISETLTLKHLTFQSQEVSLRTARFNIQFYLVFA
jgi:hypothetical protein